MYNDIQRGIVKNTYLDRLIKTIISNDNIPTITLLGERIDLSEEGKKLVLKKPRILDGLQRTYRIQEIWKSVLFFESIENKEELLKMNKFRLSRFLSEEKEKYDSGIFSAILEEYRLNGDLTRLTKGFEKNEQWFEVWEELSPRQETEKMLILNAGHHAMDYRHQLELLFLNYLGKIRESYSDNENVHIIRNKEKTDTQYSKERKTGEFYFSHIISSFISYSKGKPITTNAELINRIQQENEYGDEEISYDQINQIMMFLVEFDKLLDEEYGAVGTKWIAKETVLVGVFAALGNYDKEKGVGKAFDSFYTNIRALNLRKYDLAKQENVDVSKVNMGNITKNAVWNAITDLMNERIQVIEWDNYFGRDNK